MAEPEIIHATSWASPTFQGWVIDVAGFECSPEADFAVKDLIVADIAPFEVVAGRGTSFLLVSSEHFIPDAPARLLRAIAATEAA